MLLQLDQFLSIICIFRYKCNRINRKNLDYMRPKIESKELWEEDILTNC